MALKKCCLVIFFFNGLDNESKHQKFHFIKTRYILYTYMYYQGWIYFHKFSNFSHPHWLILSNESIISTVCQRLCLLYYLILGKQFFNRVNCWILPKNLPKQTKFSSLKGTLIWKNIQACALHIMVKISPKLEEKIKK